MITIAFRNITRNKTRTALAMLGLILGVVTIVALISITVGLKTTVTETFSGFTGVLVIEDGVNFPPFSRIDASHEEKILQIPGVSVVSPRIGAIPRTIEGERAFGEGFGGSLVFGIDPSKEARTRKGPAPLPATIIKGRGLRSSDKNSVIIGKALAEGLDLFVGSQMEINDKNFKVVGIWETGNDQTQDDIAMPIDTARKFFDFEDGKVSAFYVEVDDPSQADKIASQIQFKLEDVDALSAQQFQEQILGFLANINLFLWAIAIAATVIGGVGIINTMLMSVMERIKELGVLRAIGWTAGDVVKLIMLESAMLGIGGGFFGLLLGMGVVEVAKALTGLKMVVDLQLMLYALSFGIMVGTLGGIYPAWVASKMDPLEAIHYE